MVRRCDESVVGSAGMRYLPGLLIPLRPAGLVTLIVLSAALAASLLAGPFGVPLILILLSWFFKYSFAYLDRLASGQTQAPVLSVEMIVGTLGEFRWLVPLILVCAAFFLSGAGSHLLGAVLDGVAALGLLACLPAVLVIQGWTGRLSHSLNPRIWRAAADGLSGDYAPMVGWTLVIVLICVAAPTIIPGVPRLLRIAFVLYAWLALIGVTGTALYAHRERLAEQLPLVLRDIQVRTFDDLVEEREAWLDRIYGAWRANALENAHRTVLERVESSAEPLRELQWLSVRLSTWQPPEFSSQIARELVTRLLREDREAEALRLVKERRAVDPGFRLAHRSESLRLARVAHGWGDRGTAEALLRDSGERPSHQGGVP